MGFSGPASVKTTLEGQIQGN